MDGLYFLLAIAAVLLVARWMIVNDRIAADKPTSGLLAMDEELPPRKKKPRDRRLLPLPEPVPPPGRRV